MKKRLLKLIAFAETVLLMVGILAVMAISKEYSGVCGENATYSFDTESGILKIQGSGELVSDLILSPISIPWHENNPHIKSVEISDGITNIPEWAFYECVNLESVRIPDSVTVIGFKAFNGCTSLTSIEIPDGVVEIGSSAFENCTALADIKFPDGTFSIDRDSLNNTVFFNNVSNWENGNSLYIGKHLISVKNDVAGTFEIKPGTLTIAGSAFSGCGALTDIIIPDSVTAVGYGAFAGCTGLKSLTIPDSVTSIGSFAFGECYSLEYLSMPWVSTGTDNVYFGEYFGDYNEIVDGPLHGTYPPYSIPESLETVVLTGERDVLYPAFLGNRYVKNIIISGNIKTVGDSAFFTSYDIETLTLGKNVTYFDPWTFSRCSDIKAVYVDEDNETYCDIDGTLFSKDQKDLLQYLSDRQKYIVPESVTCIGENAFNPNKGLTSLTIGKNVQSIGEYAIGLVDTVYLYKNSFADEYFSSDDYNKIYLKDNISDGDADENGFIDKNDATVLARYLTDWNNISINPFAADCNGDGTVNSKDAVLLAQYLANWDVVLG